MNYYTIVAPERGLPCSQEDAQEIQRLLDEASDQDDLHGFQFTHEGGEGYLVAEEVGSWSLLPDALLEKVGALIAKAGLEYLEFGAAFTAGRLVPGSHGGTAFRIYADGTVVERIETWP